MLLKHARTLVPATGLALLATVAAIDVVTRPDLSFIVFYFLPVLLIVWFLGRWVGLLASIIRRLC